MNIFWAYRQSRSESSNQSASRGLVLLLANLLSIGTLDIGLIWDVANVAAPRRGPQIEVPPLGADLVAYVDQMQGEDPAPLAHIDDAPASPSQAASQDPSSSKSTPSLGAVVVPLARVQKLEAQMATLLHHVKPWMQRSISEFEARMERRMEHMMNLKVQAVNKRLDAFDLRVLERLAPITDIFSFRTELDHFWADLDAILAPSMDAPESVPIAPVDDTVLHARSSEDIPQSESSRAQGKRHHFSHTSDATEDAREKKREHQHTTYDRRASIVDEELRQ
uniref:Integrase core domain containing protein n=1 Tax=Solanum tuberosum TaxID=4113 RepID=M1DAS0_SOLTU